MASRHGLSVKPRISSTGISIWLINGRHVKYAGQSKASYVLSVQTDKRSIIRSYFLQHQTPIYVCLEVCLQAVKGKSRGENTAQFHSHAK